MLVYYFNDETKIVNVYTDTLIGPPILLQPHTGRLFEVSAPDNAIPWIKRWDRQTILVSHIDQRTLDDLDRGKSEV